MDNVAKGQFLVFGGFKVKQGKEITMRIIL